MTTTRICQKMTHGSLWACIKHSPSHHWFLDYAIVYKSTIFCCSSCFYTWRVLTHPLAHNSKHIINAPMTFVSHCWSYVISIPPSMNGKCAVWFLTTNFKHKYYINNYHYSEDVFYVSRLFHVHAWFLTSHVGALWKLGKCSMYAKPYSHVTSH